MIGAFCPSAYETSKGDGLHGILFDTFFLMLDPGSLSESMSPWYATLVAIFGIIVFTGMFISVLSNMLGRRVESYLNGSSRYKFKNHVLIFGYDDTVPSLIKSIQEKSGENKDVPSNSWIVIASNADAQTVRDHVSLHITKKEEERLVILHCHRIEKEDLVKLYLDDANLIYIIGEQNEVGHDDNNLQCLALLGSMLSKPKKCFVNLRSIQILSECRRRDLSKLIQGKALMYPYNYYDAWAEKVLIYGPNDVQDSLRYEPIDAHLMQHDSNKSVHLFIFGMTEMGKAMAIQAAQIAHFPNFHANGRQIRTRITFIDKHIKDKQADFMQCYYRYFALTRTRYCNIQADLSDNSLWEDPMTTADSVYAYLGENFIDQEWEFVEGSVNEAKVSKYVKQCVEDKGQICTLYLCDDDESKNVNDVISLDQETVDASNQVLVYQRNSCVAIDTLTDNRKVRPFGMMNSIFGERLIEENCACMLNARLNALLCGEDVAKCTTEDIRQLWYATPIEQKWALIFQGNTRFVILRSAGAQIDSSKEMMARSIEQNLPYLRETEHNRWITERLLLGVKPYTKTEYNEWLEMNPLQQKTDCADKKEKNTHICIRPTTLFSERLIDATEINPKNEEEMLRFIPTLIQEPLSIF